jgi:hypothetical protein
MNNLFIIPQLKRSFIAQVNNGQIDIVGEIDIPFNSKSVFTENGFIVSLCFDDRILKIFDIEGNFIVSKKKFIHKAIACKNSTVYLGGEYDVDALFTSGELFIIIDFDKVDFTLKNIKIPARMIQGKSIDDILINGNELILVDNVVYPKYLFKFDISNPNDPVHLRTANLPGGGTYDHIIKGDINHDWMVLFSSTSGMGGPYQHIKISGKTNGSLSRLLAFEEEEGIGDYLISDGVKYNYKDICLIDNKLYILRNNGLVYIDLNGPIANENFKIKPTKLKNLKRIFRTPDNHLIVISENDYELIN